MGKREWERDLKMCCDNGSDLKKKVPGHICKGFIILTLIGGKFDRL